MHSHLQKSIAAGIMIVAFVAVSHAQKTVTLPKLVLTEKHAELFTPPGDAPRIFTATSANTSVATATAYRGNSIQIVAVAYGKTNVTFTNAAINTHYILPVWVERANPTGGGGANYAPNAKVQLDQIVMLPKHIENVAVPNNATPKISGIKSSNEAVATARSDPPGGVQIRSERFGDTFIEFVDDTTGTPYQIHVWVTATGSLPPAGGSGASAAKPKQKPKRDPIAAPIGPVKLDPCLVGTWVSAAAPGINAPGFLDYVYRTGGLKFIVERNGRATFDYNGVPPYVSPPNAEGDSTSYKVSGRTLAKIDTYSADHSINSPAGPEEIDITVVVSNKDGASTGKINSFFPFGVQVAKYTCNAAALTMDLAGPRLTFVKQ